MKGTRTMATHEDDRPLLLLVRTGRRELREYLLRPISAAFRVHMFLGQEPTWEKEYVTGWTVFPDTLDSQAMLAEAQRINETEPVAGVMSWQESRTPQAAYVAGGLGLPGGDQDAIARCRDKHLTRQALDAAGVAQPRSVLVGTVEEALAAAERIGYPVVIKPSDLAVSFGVIKVDSPQQMPEQYEVTSAIKVPEIEGYRVRVLVEEFADGEEISVDCAVRGGRVQVLCVAHKTTGFAPYFIETGHVVDAGDPLRDDPALLALLQDTHTALGFGDGVTHSEIRFTSSGPKIIEVNARLGGDLIPYLGLRATGVDVGLAAARIACGQVPDSTPDRKLAAAVRFFNATEHNALIETIGFHADGLPDAIDTLVVLAAPGERRPIASKNPVDGRIAFATAVAPTVRECQAALDAAEAALSVTTLSVTTLPVTTSA